MLMITLQRLAAAGLFALAMTASSFTTARADWSVSGSCVGGGGVGTCVAQTRNFLRDPHVRPVRGFESQEEAEQSVKRDAKWARFCKPVALTDRYGVTRYGYAQPGCEFGRSE